MTSGELIFIIRSWEGSILLCHVPLETCVPAASSPDAMKACDYFTHGILFPFEYLKVLVKDGTATVSHLICQDKYFNLILCCKIYKTCIHVFCAVKCNLYYVYLTEPDSNKSEIPAPLQSFLGHYVQFIFCFGNTSLLQCL